MKTKDMGQGYKGANLPAGGAARKYKPRSRYAKDVAREKEKDELMKAGKAQILNALVAGPRRASEIPLDKRLRSIALIQLEAAGKISWRFSTKKWSIV